MKKIVMVLLAGTLLLVGFSTASYAQWWQDPGTAAQLGLTEEHLQQMNTRYNAYVSRVETAAPNVTAMQASVTSMMEATPLDREALKSTRLELRETMRQLHLEMMQMKNSVMRLLTPMQLMQLMQIHPKVRFQNELWFGTGSVVNTLFSSSSNPVPDRVKGQGVRR